MSKKNINFLFLFIFFVIIVIFCFIFLLFFGQLFDFKKKVFGNTEIIVKNMNINDKIELEISRIIEKTKKSVAIISAYKINNYFIEGINNSSYDRTLEYKMNLVGGTAFVVDSGGYLLTSKHVVYDKNIEYEVYLDGKKFYLDKVWFFDNLDLALIRIKDVNGNIPIIFPLSLSKKIESNLGELVMSFGNLVDQNMIAFVDTRISAIGQNFKINDDVFYSGLYIVGNILPSGFSGGPVLNMNGEVIGINTAVSNNGFSYILPIYGNLIYSFLKNK